MLNKYRQLRRTTIDIINNNKNSIHYSFKPIPVLCGYDAYGSGSKHNDEHMLVPVADSLTKVISVHTR